MNVERIFERPQLGRYPDARRATVPLFDAVLLSYLGLAFGAGVAGLIGCFNAVAIRRFGLAALSLLTGAAAWLSYAFVLQAVDRATHNVPLAVFAGRAMHFAVGSGLYFTQRAYVRGHTFLGGTKLPVMQTYAAAVLLVILLPNAVLWFLLGGVLVR